MIIAPRTLGVEIGAQAADCADVTLSVQERAVLAAVDPVELRADLAELVAIPSVGGTPAEVEVQRWCAERLHALGLAVDHWRIDLDAVRRQPDAPEPEVARTEAYGCVGTLATGTEAAALILCGHVDVVPPGDLDAWPGRDPWTLREIAGSLHGRGAADMKAGVAAAIGAVAALRRSGTQLTRPLSVHAVVGEEDGGLGAYATLQRGHRGGACVIAEPTAGTVVPANAGSLTFRLEVTGHATHGSTRTSGVSALDAAAPLFAALRDLERTRNRDPDPLFAHLDLAAPLSIGVVRAGDWPSTVPDLLVAEGRVGVLPDEPVTVAGSALEEAVAAGCAADPWLAEHPARVSWPGGVFASGRLPDGDPLLADVAGAVADAGSARPAARGAPYGSDLRLYTAAGVPTVQYGPGDVRHAHAADEQVRLDDVVLASRAYALLALRRCGKRG